MTHLLAQTASKSLIVSASQSILTVGTSLRSYLAATSRQNLETIVEAIRHLEGDHLFNDDSSGTRKGQLVEVEIDAEGEAIGCSLVVSTQDEVCTHLFIVYGKLISSSSCLRRT